MKKRPPFSPLLNRYIESDPATAAHTLETMDETDTVAILKTLPPHLCAQIFPYFQISYATSLIKEVPQILFEAIVEKMKPEQAAIILANIPPELRKELLERLPPDVKLHIQELLIYPENSAGRIMTTDFLAFHETTKIRDAIARIRQLANRHAPASYTYVVNQDNHLVGILNMRDLLLATGEVDLKSIMKTDVFSVSGFMDREEASHEISRRKFFAAPVVDEDNHILGVITTEQLVGDVHEEATEDILKMFGAGGDERTFSTVRYAMGKRLPWLFVNLVTAFLAASVVSLFEPVIAQITVLAVFLPVVAGQGGNAGFQSLAVVMRGLVLREIRPANIAKLIFKETFVGLLNGFCVGSITALIALIWKGNPYLGLVIGLAMVVNLIMAGLFGAAIPLILRACRQDPAQSSSIFLTTVTDVVGFFSFLSFATIFRNYLM